MIDWLEELLKAAEEYAGAEETEIMPELRLRNTGAAELPTAFAPVREERADTAEAGGAAARADLGRAVWKDRIAERAEPLAMVFRRTGAGGNETPGSNGRGRDPAVQWLYRQSGIGSALQVLYRQVSETMHSDLTLAAKRRNTVVVREEIPAAAGLTEKAFDRAVRRDSRRYDGGMSIY